MAQVPQPAGPAVESEDGPGSRHDNPLARWLAVAASRRARRDRSLTRSLLFWMLLTYGVITLVMGVDFCVINELPFPDFCPAAIALGLVIFGCYYLVALGRGVYWVVYTALGVLGQPSRSAGQLLIVDEMLAVSAVSSRDILSAAVSRLWPPLCRLAVGGAVLFWMVALAFPLDSLHNWQSLREAFVGRLLIWAPLTIAAVAASGILAGLVMVLWFIALGRGTRPGWLRSALAGLVVVAQVAVNPAAGYYALSTLVRHHARALEPSEVLTSVLSTLAVVAASWLLMIAALRLAEFAGRVHPLLPASPLLIGAGSAVLFFTLFVWVPLPWPVQRPLLLLPSASIPAWTACFLTNPLAVPYVDLLGFTMIERVDRIYSNNLLGSLGFARYALLHPVEWFRYPLLTLQLLGMVLIAHYYALRAVVRRRREMV